jgi:hypothetical protein
MPQVDNEGFEQDHIHGSESTWPAERVPGKLDAEQANRPLDSSFMQSFKHALLADEAANETCDFLDDDNEDLIHVSDVYNSQVGSFIHVVAIG